MIPTDETCGYESSLAKEHMTYPAEVELPSVFIRRQKPTKETAEANEDLPLGVPCFPVTGVTHPVFNPVSPTTHS